MKTLFPGLGLLLVAACSHGADFDETGGVKIVRSACPAIAVPAYTGDITLFDPPASRDARAIDVVADITNVRGGCTEAGDKLAASATFEVQARRSSGDAAREVVLPYFVTVTRAGTQIVSKQVGRAVLRFAPGELRASTSASVAADISRSAATLADDIQRKINRKRKAGDADAAIDPMADPVVRAAVSNASFELLVGFQLTDEQLGYNATR